MINFKDFTLNENSFYNPDIPQEKTDFLADEEQIKINFWINIIGTLGLTTLLSNSLRKTPTLIQYLKNDKKVRLQSIDDSNNDVSLIIKLASDKNLLTPPSTITKLTKLLAKLKFGEITKINEGLLRDLLNEFKWEKLRPSNVIVKNAVKEFLDGGTVINSIAKFYQYCKKSKTNLEFYSLAKRNQYLFKNNSVVDPSTDSSDSVDDVDDVTKPKHVINTPSQDKGVDVTTPPKDDIVVDNEQEMINLTLELLISNIKDYLGIIKKYNLNLKQYKSYAEGNYTSASSSSYKKMQDTIAGFNNEKLKELFYKSNIDSYNSKILGGSYKSMMFSVVRSSFFRLLDKSDFFGKYIPMTGDDMVYNRFYNLSIQSSTDGKKKIVEKIKVDDYIKWYVEDLVELGKKVPTVYVNYFINLTSISIEALTDDIIKTISKDKKKFYSFLQSYITAHHGYSATENDIFTLRLFNKINNVLGTNLTITSKKQIINLENITYERYIKTINNNGQNIIEDNLKLFSTSSTAEIVMTKFDKDYTKEFIETDFFQSYLNDIISYEPSDEKELKYFKKIIDYYLNGEIKAIESSTTLSEQLTDHYVQVLKSLTSGFAGDSIIFRYCADIVKQYVKAYLEKSINNADYSAYDKLPMFYNDRIISMIYPLITDELYTKIYIDKIKNPSIETSSLTVGATTGDVMKYRSNAITVVLTTTTNKVLLGKYLKNIITMRGSGDYVDNITDLSIFKKFYEYLINLKVVSGDEVVIFIKLVQNPLINYIKDNYNSSVEFYYTAEGSTSSKAYKKFLYAENYTYINNEFKLFIKGKIEKFLDGRKFDGYGPDLNNNAEFLNIPMVKENIINNGLQLYNLVNKEENIKLLVDNLEKEDVVKVLVKSISKPLSSAYNGFEDYREEINNMLVNYYSIISETEQNEEESLKNISDIISKSIPKEKQAIASRGIKNTIILFPIMENFTGDVISPHEKTNKDMIFKAMKFNQFTFNDGVSYSRKGTPQDYFDKVINVIKSNKSSVQLPELKVGRSEISNDELELKTIEYHDKYNKGKHGGITIQLLEEFDVNLDSSKYDEFVRDNPDTEIMTKVFHGTSSLAASFILRTGFKITTGNLIKAGRMLGDGIYFTDVLDKASQYVHSGSDVSRRFGTVGYVLEMEAALGKKGTHYSSAEWTVSPEWCVFYPGNQIKIKKAYKVVLQSLKWMNNLKIKHGVYNEELKKKLMSKIII